MHIQVRVMTHNRNVMMILYKYFAAYHTKLISSPATKTLFLIRDTVRFLSSAQKYYTNRLLPMLFYHLSTPILRHSWPFFKHYNMYKCTTVLIFVIYKSYIHMCTMLSTKLGTLGTFTPICALANIAVIHSSNIAVQKNVYKVLLGSVVHLRKHFSE